MRKLFAFLRALFPTTHCVTDYAFIPDTEYKHQVTVRRKRGDGVVSEKVYVSRYCFVWYEIPTMERVCAYDAAEGWDALARADAFANGRPQP